MDLFGNSCCGGEYERATRLQYNDEWVCVRTELQRHRKWVLEVFSILRGQFYNTTATILLSLWAKTYCPFCWCVFYMEKVMKNLSFSLSGNMSFVPAPLLSFLALSLRSMNSFTTGDKLWKSCHMKTKQICWIPAGISQRQKGKIKRFDVILTV